MTLNIYSPDDNEYSAHISYVWKALYAIWKEIDTLN